MNEQLPIRSNTPGGLLRRYPILANLTLAVASTLLALIVVEMILRAFIPLSRPEPALFRIPDPVLGWALQPNGSYLYTMPEATVSVTYNSEGFHDVEHAIPKPRGIFRILVLGDSFMEANGVELSETFHRQLEWSLRSSGRNVEVISLGVSGYGTLQELMMLQSKGQRYEPDLVLLAFFAGNDLVNNSLELESIFGKDRIYTFARPFLDASDPEHWTVTPIDFEGIQRRYEEVQSSLDPKNYRLVDRIMLLRVARTGLQAIRGNTGLDTQEEDLSVKSQKELAYLGVDYCAEAPEYTRSWETTERILTKLKQDVELHGAKLVVFSVPTFEEASTNYRAEALSNAVHPEKLCFEDAPSQARLGQLLMKLGIDFIPLLSDFREAAREDDIELYRLGDLHWNPQGHALAAQLVEAELVRRGLLPAPTQLNIISAPR